MLKGGKWLVHFATFFRIKVIIVVTIKEKIPSNKNKYAKGMRKKGSERVPSGSTLQPIILYVIKQRIVAKKQSIDIIYFFIRYLLILVLF